MQASLVRTEDALALLTIDREQLHASIAERDAAITDVQAQLAALQDHLTQEQQDVATLLQERSVLMDQHAVLLQDLAVSDQRLSEVEVKLTTLGQRERDTQLAISANGLEQSSLEQRIAPLRVTEEKERLARAFVEQTKANERQAQELYQRAMADTVTKKGVYDAAYKDYIAHLRSPDKALYQQAKDKAYKDWRDAAAAETAAKNTCRTWASKVKDAEKTLAKEQKIVADLRKKYQPELARLTVLQVERSQREQELQTVRQSVAVATQQRVLLAEERLEIEQMLSGKQQCIAVLGERIAAEEQGVQATQNEMSSLQSHVYVLRQQRDVLQQTDVEFLERVRMAQQERDAVAEDVLSAQTALASTDADRYCTALQLQDVQRELERRGAEASPIQVALSLVKTDGPNVLVRFASPADASVLSIEGGGLLSSTTQDHPGGTRCDTAVIAFNASRPAGVYRLTLRDAAATPERRSIALRWEPSARRLGVVDQDDIWSPEDLSTQMLALTGAQVVTDDVPYEVHKTLELEAMSIQAQQVSTAQFDRLTQLTSIDISDGVLRRLQYQSLYITSSLFLSYENATERYFLTAYPYFRPENFTAYVDSEWARKPTYSRGQVYDMCVSRRLDMLNRFQRAVNNFNEAMIEHVFPAAMNVFISIRQGSAEAPLVTRVADARNFLQTSHTQELYQCGFTTPSVEVILAGARETCTNEVDRLLHYQEQDDWITNGQAEEQVRRHMEYLRAKAEQDSAYLDARDITHQVDREDALQNMEFVAERTRMEIEAARAGQVSEASQTRRQQRALRLVQSAAQGTDPRVRLVLAAEGAENIQRTRAMPDGTVEVLVLPEEMTRFSDEFDAILLQGGDVGTVVDRMADSAEEAGDALVLLDNVIVQKYLVAQAGESDVSTEEDLVFGHRLQTALGISIEQGTYLQFFACLYPQDREAIYQQVLDWYQPHSETNGRLGGLFADPLSTAGRVALGLADGLRETAGGAVWRGETRETLILKAAAVTGIDPRVFLQIPTNDVDMLERQLTQIFSRSGYDVFHADRLPAEVVQVPQAYTDGRLQQDGTVRVHFDLPLRGGSIDGVQLRAVTTGMQRDIGAALPYRLYADIAVAQLGQTGEEAKVEVTVNVGGKQRVMLTEFFAVPAPLDIVTNAELSTLGLEDPDRQVENAILQRVHFPVQREAGNWFNQLGSVWHTGNEYYSVDLNLSQSSDLGQAVYAAAAGRVIWVDTVKWGGVMIEHTAQVMVDGREQTVTWRTKYIHMQNIANSSGVENAPWQVGDMVYVGQQIGAVGKEQTDSPHLHFVVYKQLADATWGSINLEHWLDLLEVSDVGARYVQPSNQ